MTLSLTQSINYVDKEAFEKCFSVVMMSDRLARGCQVVKSHSVSLMSFEQLNVQYVQY